MRVTAEHLRSLGRILALGLALGLLWSSIPGVPAQAATATYYLGSEAVPLAGLLDTPPTATTLPNYDPGRDDLPGIVLQPTLSGGVLETDPTRYQQWAAAKGGVAIDGSVTFRFWSAAQDFASDTRGTVRVGLHDCNQPETQCDLIALDTVTADSWSPAGDWTQHTMHWPLIEYDIPNGHHLMVKLVVGATSDTPLLFAYDAVDYPSRLEVDAGPLNQPPAAANDAVETDEDMALRIEVLGNDTDPDGDILGLVAASAAGHGSVLVNGDGSVTYTPDSNWNGVDGFTYTISDGETSANADVIVTVSPVNDAPVAVDDQTSTAEDTSVDIDVLENDVDVDVDHLVVSSILEPATGAAEIAADGRITFTPVPDWSGTAIVGYEVFDGLSSDSGLVEIVVYPVNDAPVVADDEALVPEDGSVTVDLLANDTDIDSASLVITDVGMPDRGTATMVGGGMVMYTPDANFHGSDSFQYEASDGATSSTATVRVTVSSVNDAPVASDVVLAILEDSSISFRPIAEASDVDGDLLVLVSVDGPAHGVATIQTSGEIVVTPHADWHGTTTLHYTVSDGSAEATAEVQIDVLAVNDVPVAVADVASTVEDGAVLIDVLGNDVDVDGDELLLVSVVGAGSGSAEVEAGSIRYAPAADWSGTEVLTYAVSDGSAVVTGAVTVTVDPVNDAPASSDDAATIDEDTAVSIAVLDNDVDADGDDLVVTFVSDPGAGTTEIVGGHISYVPYPDTFGADTFTYIVTDPSGASSVGTVVITVVPVNDVPQAENDLVVTAEDAAVRVEVLANDTDRDGDELTTEIVGVPAAGLAHVGDDGSVVYQPEPNWNGVVNIVYQASDGVAATQGVLNVIVSAVNDAPIAVADHVEVGEDGSVTLDPVLNDIDVDGDVLAVTAWMQPSSGSVAAADGKLTYTPAPDYSGSDSFSYTVTDGRGGFAAALVAVIIHPVADPLNLPDTASADPTEAAITIDLTNQGVDFGPDGFEIVAVTQGEFGAVTPNGDGTLSFVPSDHFAGFDSFRYVVTDGKVVQAAEVTVSWEFDGAALVEISMTPTAVSLAEWVPAAQPGGVVADEASSAVARLAAPAAAAAAAAGATILSQSQSVARVAARIGRLLFGRT